MPNKPDYTNILAFGGGVTSALLVGAAMSYAAKKSLEDVPEYKRKPRGVFTAAKKDYGVDVGYTSEKSNKGNAFFIPKSEVDRIEPKVTKLRRILDKAKSQGLIVTGPGYKRPGVIEHEIGHAIASEGNPWERFTQSRAASFLSGLGSAGGTFGGIYAGKKWGAPAGALTGLGIAGLGNLPLIHGEILAHQYGKELLPEGRKGVNPWPFVGTYASAGLTLPVVSGALAGLLGKR